MTIAMWCVFIAAMMPYIFTTIAKAGSGKKFNNSKPRESLAALELGWAKRANFAQQNSFEALSTFVPAVIISHFVGVEQTTIDNLAMLFIVFRVVYGFCYIFNYNKLRTLIWAGGFTCVIKLFLAASRVAIT